MAITQAKKANKAGKAAKATSKTVIIDAANAPVGRVAARVAKQALSGDNVVITNIDAAVISGNPVRITEGFRGRRGIQQKSNPEHSPKWPRRADFLFKKMLTGMLPKRSSRSAEAMHRVKAYYGVPAEFEGKPSEKMAKPLSCRSMTLGKLCEELGFNK